MKTKSFTRHSIAVLLTTILLLVAIPATAAFAASAGANYPGTAASGGGTGSFWSASSGTLVAALGADGGTTASTSVSGFSGSENLDMTNFGFSIPTDATITGISVEMNRYAANSGLQDSNVRLFRSGSLVGNNKAAGAWSTLPSTVVTYGSSSDLWGTTWTPAEINASSFGVTLDISNSSVSSRTANVDYVRITVSYTQPNAATTTTVTSSKNPSTYGDSVTFTATVTSTSTPTGSVNFVIDGGSAVAGTAGGTTATTATWTYTISTLSAGSHTVQAHYVHTGLFNDSSDTLSGGQTVNKADATCSVNGFSGAYDAAAHGASGSCTGVNDEEAGTLDLGASFTNVPGGTADWTFTGNGNYNDRSGSADITITKADADCSSVVGYSDAYDAAAHGTNGSCTGIGSEEAGTFDPGLSYTNVPGGTADWTFTGNGNYNDQSGTVNITISKRDADCTVTGFNGAYDAAAHGASGSCTGVGGEDAGTLDLGTSYANVPGGIADWTFTGNGNYNDQSGSVNITIAKANADCSSITGFNGAYDAAAHGTSGACTGVGGEDAGTLDLGDSFVNVPGGSADWAFTGNSNYNDQSGSVNITIAKANADCSSIDGYSVVYDGTPFTAAGSCMGVAGEGALDGVDLSATTHTDAGTYDGDAWTFTAPNDNYNDASGFVNSMIAKADAVISVQPYDVTFDGSAHLATGSATGVSGEDLDASLDLSLTSHTNAGSYAGDIWTFIAPNSNYNDANGEIDNNIAKANADCSSIAGYSVIYDGTPFTAAGSCMGIAGEGALDGLDLSATTHIEIGSYTDDPWTFTDVTGNYNDASGTVNNVISDKLVPSVTVSGGPFTYDGSSHAATVTSPVAGTVSNVKYDGSDTVPSNAGTYAVTADFLPDDTATYETLVGASAGSITIDRADPVCTISGYNVTYNGAPHTATGSCLGVGSDGTLTGLDLSATTHTNVGTYPGDSWTFTDVTGNYNNASGTVNSVINPVADTTAPTVLSVVRASANNTSAASVAYTVTFSEAVTGVDTGDFSLFTSGINGAAVTAVSGSGSTYTVTVNTGAGTGKLRLNVLDNDSIKDAANNKLGGTGAGNGSFTTGETYNILKGADTVGVFRPSNGLLYLKNSNTTGYADIAINYGQGGDYPVVGDWDGNGTATIGIYRNGSFYLRNSNTVGNANLQFPFGKAGDQPIAGDWNGDGIDTIGVFDPKTFTFSLRNSNTAGPAEMVFQLGIPGDVGIAGDWNGDGKDTVGVFRPSNGVIFLKNSNQTGYADIALNYGQGGDKPVTGDWDNDGIDTIGVLRGNMFYLRNSNTVGNANLEFALGLYGDMPIAGNWDGKP